MYRSSNDVNKKSKNSNLHMIEIGMLGMILYIEDNIFRFEFIIFKPKSEVLF